MDCTWIENGQLQRLTSLHIHLNKKSKSLKGSPTFQNGLHNP